MTTKPGVLIWGIAGASLGMEVAKSLKLDGGFSIYGCDISSGAFGHFSQVFDRTFVLDRDSPIETILANRERLSFGYLVAGGDEVARICADQNDELDSIGVTYVGNSASVVSLCSDKYASMLSLESHGVPVPWTKLLSEVTPKDHYCPFPLVVKPRQESGGSRGISVVRDSAELTHLMSSIRGEHQQYVCQEYLKQDSDELTIGVLSSTSREVAGAILMRRAFHSRLSVMASTSDYLISSGSSQGAIFTDTSISQQALHMASVLQSSGPMNIQGRLRDGKLIPFEINPRFSASVYLRALAGVNEPALYIRHLSNGAVITYPTYQNGLALRSFTEIFAPEVG